jgi:uncharacterized protein YndB with AHSA1/START domain
VDLEASVDLDVPAERVYAEVADLSTYPEWLGIVLEAESDGEGAWYIDLGARVGPVKAAKRVRMVRAVDEPPARVRFERSELDDEEHSPWVLEATIVGNTTLTMHLHYGGAMFFPGLDKILGAEVDRAGERLRDRL